MKSTYTTYDSNGNPVKHDNKKLAWSNRTLAQHQAATTYKNLMLGLNGITQATRIPTRILKKAETSLNELRDLQERIFQASKELSHNFTICPSCNTALTGRKIRKDNKKQVFLNCDICNTLKDKPNFRIRSKYSLEEARAKLTTTNPEIFI